MTKKDLKRKCKEYNLKWEKLKKLIKEMNWKCRPLDDKKD